MIARDRRDFLGMAVLAGAALGAALPARAAAPGTPRWSLREIDAGDLRIAFAEAGPEGGKPVILLHGWPYDIHSFAEVAPILAAAGKRVIVPFLRGYGGTRFRSEATLRNGQQAALAVDVVALMQALAIDRAVIGGFDWGARTAAIVAALWPERCGGLVSVSGYLIGSREANRAPLPPAAEYQWWYQYYFATDRGAEGYRLNTRDFTRLIWKQASPRWSFGEDTFARSAAAFENPDHAAIVIHNYRWRLGLVDGEARYGDLERRLAALPPIAVPAITLEGDANGAPHPDPATYRGRFSGAYQHRQVGGGVGHNLPQEAPRDFAAAIIAVTSLDPR